MKSGPILLVLELGSLIALGLVVAKVYIPAKRYNSKFTKTSCEYVHHGLVDMCGIQRCGIDVLANDTEMVLFTNENVTHCYDYEMWETNPCYFGVNEHYNGTSQPAALTMHVLNAFEAGGGSTDSVLYDNTCMPYNVVMHIKKTDGITFIVVMLSIAAAAFLAALRSEYKDQCYRW